MIYKRTLEKFIHPVSLEKFGSKYYEKKPVCLKKTIAQHRKSPIINIQSLQGFLKEYIIDANNCRVFNSTKQVQEEAYVIGSRDEKYIDSERVIKLAEMGSLIAIKGGEKLVPKLSHLCHAFDASFNIKSKAFANLYFSTKNAEGLRLHYDNQEVFIQQLAGKRVWTIYYPTDVLADKPCPAEFSQEIKRYNIYGKFVLEVGDILYIPRGYIHKAEALLDSVHVTIAYFPQTGSLKKKEVR